MFMGARLANLKGIQALLHSILVKPIKEEWDVQRSEHFTSGQEDGAKEEL